MSEIILIPALTVLQPWASLIRIGAKRFETRGWSTKHRGPTAIHAGAKLAKVEDITPEIFKALVDGGVITASCPLKEVPYFLPLAAVLCLADLLDCHKTERMTFPGELQLTPEYHFGNFEPGRFGWELKLTRVFNPAIPAKGQQGLWKWVCLSSYSHPEKGATMAKGKSTKNKPADTEGASEAPVVMDEAKALEEKGGIDKAFSTPVERPGVATDPAFDNSEDAGDVEDPIVPRMPQVKTFAEAVDPSEVLPTFQKIIYIEFSEAEYAAKGKELAAMFQEQNELEAERSKMNKEMGDKIKAVEARKELLAAQIDARGEEKEIECRKRINDVTNVAVIFDAKTLEIIEEKKLTASEIQTELRFRDAHHAARDLTPPKPPKGTNVIKARFDKKIGTSEKPNAELEAINDAAVKALANDGDEE